MARDRVELERERLIATGGATTIEQLTLLDERLRAAARTAAFPSAAARWRATARPPVEAWWWSGERELPRSLAKGERLVELATLVLLPLSLAFAVDLATRFGSEGGGIAAALPIVAATTLGSVRIVASSFRPRVTAGLRALGLEGRYWRPVVSLLILTGLLAICLAWLARPSISRFYNDRGALALASSQPQLAVARLHFERALRFDPGNPVAHYNLATVHEDLSETDKAAIEYRIALAAGLDVARNNLGRLYVRAGDFDRAASLLTPAVTDLVANPTIEPDVQYNLLKNLGWARMGQRRPAEARRLLERAASVAPERAAAHCLLGRLLSETSDAAAAAEWQQCLRWADPRNPDDDVWLAEARAALTPDPPPRSDAR